MDHGGEAYPIFAPTQPAFMAGGVCAKADPLAHTKNPVFSTHRCEPPVNVKIFSLETEQSFNYGV
jgi:hypothetical protein